MESGKSKRSKKYQHNQNKSQQKSRESIKNLSLGNSKDITNIGLCDYNALQFSINFVYKQREGFLNKMLLRYHLRLKNNERIKLENYFNLKIIANSNDPSSSFMYGRQIREREPKNYHFKKKCS